MLAYPVHYAVERPPSYTRLQLLVRIAASMALGILGLSLGLLYLAAFIALPAFAAARIGASSGASYLREDGPRVQRALAWFAAVYAWFALVTDTLPARAPDEQVHITVAPTGTPTPATALARVILGVPSAFVLAFVACVGGVVWLWSVLTVLLSERVGAGAHAFLTGVQRWAVRLLAYQASLVDVYPPFSFDDAAAALPEASVHS